MECSAPATGLPDCRHGHRSCPMATPSFPAPGSAVDDGSASSAWPSPWRLAGGGKRGDGEDIAQIALAVQPLQRLQLGANYANKGWDGRMQALDLSADWKPRPARSFGMQGGSRAS